MLASPLLYRQKSGSEALSVNFIAVCVSFPPWFAVYPEMEEEMDGLFIIETEYKVRAEVIL